MSVFFKKQTVASYSLLASFVLGLVGFIIYLVNSTTGFLAGQPVDALLIALTIVALLLIVLEFTLHDKLEMFNGVINDVILIAIGVLFAVSCCLFINDRVSLAADVYFIPVNYPAAEESALNVGIVGVVFYALAMIASSIAAFVPMFYSKKGEA